MMLNFHNFSCVFYFFFIFFNLLYREIQEARDLEYEAWGCVQSLKSSLDEHSLELRVKTANEAEARSQQTLAAAEAEIADMIHKLEAAKRSISCSAFSCSSTFFFFCYFVF